MRSTVPKAAGTADNTIQAVANDAPPWSFSRGHWMHCSAAVDAAELLSLLSQMDLGEIE
jgi:hypothetical protein